MSLFGREYKVTVDNLDVSGMDVEFKILRTIKREPNKAAVVVYNLSDDHRAQLLKRNRPNPDSKKLVGIPVQVFAGYVGQSQLLLRADLDQVASVYEPPSWKTTIAGSDGGRSFREARINSQFGKGTPIGVVLKACCDAMGIGDGNASTLTKDVAIPSIGQTLAHGMTLHGSAAAALDRVVNSIRVTNIQGKTVDHALTWSIQNGALQLLPDGVPLGGLGFELSASSGLIGSPEATIDASVSLGNPQQFLAGAKSATKKAPKPKDPGIVRFKSLLVPGIAPGRRVRLRSKSISGDYMVTEVEYVGQSAGNDWYCNCVGRQTAAVGGVAS